MVSTAFFVGVGLSHYPQSGADAVTQTKSKVENGPAAKNSVDGIDLAVVLPKSVREGERIEMKVMLSNNGRLPVWVGNCGDIIECWVGAIDSNGKPVPYTTRGECKLSEHSRVRGMYARWPLQPGKSSSWSYDIEPCFEFAKGLHELSLTAKLRWENDGKPFTVTVHHLALQIN